MKRTARRIYFPLVIGLLLAAGIIIFCGNAMAATVISSILTVTPSTNVKPGSVVKFRARVYHNPAFTVPPGTKIECWVTRHDFSWKTEDRFPNYPGPGKQVFINFTKGFTVPANAKAADTFDFYLVWGIYYPMSPKTTVRIISLIKAPIQKIEKKPIIKKKKIRSTTTD